MNSGYKLDGIFFLFDSLYPTSAHATALSISVCNRRAVGDLYLLQAFLVHQGANEADASTPLLCTQYNP